MWKVFRSKLGKGCWSLGFDKTPGTLHITIGKWCWTYYEDNF